MNIGELNMKDVNLERLLGKYYDGLTSETEERVLMEYLLSDDLPEEYEADREVVCSLVGMSADYEPAPGFEKEIIKKLGSGGKQKGRTSFRQMYWSISGIAATLFLAVSIWFLAGKSNEPDDTFSSPELAYAETVRVLHKISSEMNRGTSALTNLESINRAADGMTTVESTGRYLRKGFNVVEDIYGRLGTDIEDKR
ncbi:MAG: hypothetical protein R6W67_04760 [Bacteroidales bacterium]